MATVPTAPQIYPRPLVQPTAITFWWDAPASDGGSAITGYTLTCTSPSITRTVAANARSAYITGLTAGTTYAFTIVATNAIGPSPTAAFRAVTCGQRPDGPTGVQATLEGSNAGLISWIGSASSNDSPIIRYKLTGYAYDSNDAAIASSTIYGNTYDNQTNRVISPVGPYLYRVYVQAANDAGLSAVSSFSTINNLPVPPPTWQYDFVRTVYANPRVYAFSFTNPGGGSNVVYQTYIQQEDDQFTRVKINNYFLPSNDTAWTPTTLTSYGLSSELEITNGAGYRSVFYFYSSPPSMSDSIGTTHTVTLKYWYPSNSNVIEYYGVVITRIADT